MANKQITTREYYELVDKVIIEDPSKEDVKALRKALHNNPKLWRIVGDLAEQAVFNLIGEIKSSPALKESLKTGWKEMQKELGGENPNPLEKLLVQQVVMSWLRLQLVEYHFTEVMNQSITLNLGRYWESRLSAAQRRHLRAIETLARVRRLLSKTPAVQVNIAAEGGKQVNVAGDVKLSEKARGSP